MIVAGRFAERFGRLRLVIASAAGATVFFCLLPLARSAAPLLALQVLNAAWSAVALSIPMVMMQEEVRRRGWRGVLALQLRLHVGVLLAGAVTGVTAAAIGSAACSGCARHSRQSRQACCSPGRHQWGCGRRETGAALTQLPEGHDA